MYGGDGEMYRANGEMYRGRGETCRGVLIFKSRRGYLKLLEVFALSPFISSFFCIFASSIVKMAVQFYWKQIVLVLYSECP